MENFNGENMSIVIDKEILNKYDVAGPRYTSYPTAPQWDTAVNASVYEQKLALFGLSHKTLSLYIHIPFCEQLCYFCACNKVIRPQDPRVGDEYLSHLFVEIEKVASAIKTKKTIKQLHWGGGTPSYLSIEQSKRLMDKIKRHFDVDPQGEIAIEIDPRTVKDDKITALRQMGFNRVSLGVQDFDPKVQDDINRIQPFEVVEHLYRVCRQLEFKSVNFDLIYGLPYQTRITFSDTVRRVIDLKPDRIALYSFAYVPWLSKPQNKFNLEAIALHDEKLDIFIQSRQHLLDAGYEAIAMDHFALKTDDMAIAFRNGDLHRNFMGYTLKPADEFIGLGVSAIGFIEGTFVQNVKTLPEYYECLGQGNLPVHRGKELSQDDLIRQWVIHQLMCRFTISKNEFKKRFDLSFDEYFYQEKEHVQKCVQDGLIRVDADVIKATALGAMFIRNVCMGFDWYLRQEGSHKRFSKTV